MNVDLHRYVVHSPTNALFINLVKSFKFTLKYTIISLLHVSVFNDHHIYIYIYIKRRNFTECCNINITLVSYR